MQLLRLVRLRLKTYLGQEDGVDTTSAPLEGCQELGALCVRSLAEDIGLVQRTSIHLQSPDIVTEHNDLGRSGQAATAGAGACQTL